MTGPLDRLIHHLEGRIRVNESKATELCRSALRSLTSQPHSIQPSILEKRQLPPSPQIGHTVLQIAPAERPQQVLHHRSADRRGVSITLCPCVAPSAVSPVPRRPLPLRIDHSDNPPCTSSAAPPVPPPPLPSCSAHSDNLPRMDRTASSRSQTGSCRAVARSLCSGILLGGGNGWDWDVLGGDRSLLVVVYAVAVSEEGCIVVVAVASKKEGPVVAGENTRKGRIVHEIQRAGIVLAAGDVGRPTHGPRLAWRRNTSACLDKDPCFYQMGGYSE
jgi:hypothetical protein